MKRVIILTILAFVFQPLLAQRLKDYKRPSPELEKTLKQAKMPAALVSPNGEYLLQRFTYFLPAASETSKNQISWMGTVTDSITGLPAFQKFDTSFTIISIDKRTSIDIEGIEAKLRITYIKWSPDSKYLAFTNFNGKNLELWICNINQQKATRAEDIYLNAFISPVPFVWLPNSLGLLVNTTVNQKIDFKPAEGPFVFDNESSWGHLPEMSLLHRFAFSNALFEKLATGQLCQIDVKGNTLTIGQTAMLKKFQPSPDGQFILVEFLHRPFVFTAPAESFPVKIEIWDNQGNLFRELFDLPSTANKSFVPGSVIKQARNVSWCPFEQATLYWLKASDGGEATREAAIRDKLYHYSMPFDGDPEAIIDFNLRCTGIVWASGNCAFAKQEWPLTGETQWYWFNPGISNTEKRLLVDYNAYAVDTNYQNLLFTSDNIENRIASFDSKTRSCFFTGTSVLATGEFPFIMQYQVETNSVIKSWQSLSPYYELPLAVINPEKQTFLTCRQSGDDSPNYFSRNTASGVVEQLTTYPSVADRKLMPYSRFVTFNTTGSIPVSGLFSVPPGYKVGDARLPVLVWIIPDRQTSNRLVINQNYINRFLNLEPFSPRAFALKGYAVLEVTLPVFTDSPVQKTDTTEQQMLLTAEAIQHFLDSLPTIDKDRICIGGISAGASVAANMLLGSRLFKSGLGIGGLYTSGSSQWYYNPEFNNFQPVGDRNADYLETAPKIPFLIVEGQYSPTLIDGEQFYIKLKQYGMVSRMIIFPDNSSMPSDYQTMAHLYWEIENWLDKTLKGSKEK